MASTSIFGPFDVIILGAGMFGPVVATRMLERDSARQRRILMLEAGEFIATEHLHNLPDANFEATAGWVSYKSIADTLAWQLPWRSDVRGGFPGLAACIGGRSLFFGGWTPCPLDSELPKKKWPKSVIRDLAEPLSNGSAGYLNQAAKLVGVTSNKKSVYGPLHQVIHEQLYGGIAAGRVNGISSTLLVPNGQNFGQSPLIDAPIAAKLRPNSSRTGGLMLEKFSSASLLLNVAHRVASESLDSNRSTFMVVPGCKVLGLIADAASSPQRVAAIETNRGPVQVSKNALVVLALGTIESTRMAKIFLSQDSRRIGINLMAHLRSNLTIRVRRESIIGIPTGVLGLQTSALLLRGRHTHADRAYGHFHLQITAAGLTSPDSDFEYQLRSTVVDIDSIDQYRRADENHIVISIRGVGEMRPETAGSSVELSDELDEYGFRRSFVQITTCSEDDELWDAMDQAADDVASVITNGFPYEVLVGDDFVPVPSGCPASSVIPWQTRRDGLGTSHHEAGTLRMGTSSVYAPTNENAGLHGVSNLYAVGPALFPTVGSSNPTLLGVALGLRLADHLSDVLANRKVAEHSTRSVLQNTRVGVSPNPEPAITEEVHLARGDA